MRVRRVDVGADDGYASPLLPGLHSSADAERLADEMAFAAGRLVELAVDPPGLYAEIATGSDAEEAIWLAFQVALFSPLDGVDDPFASIAAVRTTWASGEVPQTDGVPTGPRSPLAGRGNGSGTAAAASTFAAYRAFASRAGSQLAAVHGEDFWKPDRRFARSFERMALPGLPRATRFDFLSALGATGRIDARAASLMLGAGADEASVAAKRVFGIGDPLVIDRRALALCEAAGVPVEALDLALANWQRGERARLGATEQAEDAELRERVGAALRI
jgi:hypothetical protein